MSDRYPLKLSPVAKTAIWGGERLRRDWQKPSNLPVVAETWELTVRKNENNLIQNGPFGGKILADVLKNREKSWIGTDHSGDRFPLLIKFIDANDRLSVQVHPDDEFAAKAEGDLGKTEMWYIVDADEGASILWGLVPGATAEDFAKASAAGDPEPVLRRVEVKKGDCFFIPAGMPHAIGKGILVAEIQQNCDLTYRVYDYNRRDKDGNLRELHVEKAMQVTKPFSKEEIHAIRYAKGSGDDTLLAACPYFSVKRILINGAHIGHASERSFHALLFLSGEGTVEANGTTVTYCKGDSIFLPAGIGEYHIRGNGEVLITTL